MSGRIEGTLLVEVREAALRESFEYVTGRVEELYYPQRSLAGTKEADAVVVRVFIV